MYPLNMQIPRYARDDRLPAIQNSCHSARDSVKTQVVSNPLLPSPQPDLSAIARRATADVGHTASSWFASTPSTTNSCNMRAIPLSSWRTAPESRSPHRAQWEPDDRPESVAQAQRREDIHTHDGEKDAQQHWDYVRPFGQIFEVHSCSFLCLHRTAHLGGAAMTRPLFRFVLASGVQVRSLRLHVQESSLIHTLNLPRSQPAVTPPEVQHSVHGKRPGLP